MKEAEILRSAASELGKYINDINEKLKADIQSTDLDDPDYHDYQTPHELVVIAKRYEELHKEVEILRRDSNYLNRLIDHGLLCGDCRGTGQVGNAPDDYYDCPTCKAAMGEIESKAVMGLIMNAHYTCETSTGDSAWSTEAIEEYANSLKDKS